MRRIFPDRFRTILLLIVFLLGVSVPSSRAISIQADDQFRYAQTLFEDHDYSQASAEFRRFLHFFPDDPRAQEALYRIGISHYRAHDYRMAIRSFRRMVDQADFSGPYFSSYYMLSQCYLRLDQAPSAVTTLNNLAVITDDPNEKDAARYALGWIHLEDLWAEGIHMPFDSFAAARTYFDKIGPSNRSIYKLDLLEAEFHRAERIPAKNPWVAGSLSIIPGGGQLYCRRYQDAVTALIVNTAFGVAAYESFDHELYALGGLISLVGMGFYVGNIYGAVSDAHKYNREQRRYFIHDLKTRFQVHFSMDKPFVFSIQTVF